MTSNATTKKPIDDVMPGSGQLWDEAPSRVTQAGFAAIGVTLSRLETLSKRQDDEPALTAGRTEMEVMTMAECWLEEAVLGVQQEERVTYDVALRGETLEHLVEALPDHRLRQAVDRVLFEEWAKQGWLDDCNQDDIYHEDSLMGFAITEVEEIEVAANHHRPSVRTTSV